MKTTGLLIFSLCVAVFLYAQSPVEKGKASLRVLNEQKQPVENATVELLRSRDSSLVKTALSDKNGFIDFDNISFNSYLIKISSVNHTVTYTAPFSIDISSNSASLADVTPHRKTATEMQGVTVTAKKPFIQKLNDRIVVNVEAQ